MGGADGGGEPAAPSSEGPRACARDGRQKVVPSTRPALRRRGSGSIRGRSPRTLGRRRARCCSAMEHDTSRQARPRDVRTRLQDAACRVSELGAAFERARSTPPSPSWCSPGRQGGKERIVPMGSTRHGARALKSYCAREAEPRKENAHSAAHRRPCSPASGRAMTRRGFSRRSRDGPSRSRACHGSVRIRCATCFQRPICWKAARLRAA